MNQIVYSTEEWAQFVEYVRQAGGHVTNTFTLQDGRICVKYEWNNGQS